jgi:hypothetical protein
MGSDVACKYDEGLNNKLQRYDSLCFALRRTLRTERKEGRDLILYSARIIWYSAWTTKLSGGLWGHLASIQRVRGAAFTRLKRSALKLNTHQVKNEWSCTGTSPYLYGVHRNNFQWHLRILLYCCKLKQWNKSYIFSRDDVLKNSQRLHYNKWINNEVIREYVKFRMIHNKVDEHRQKRMTRLTE